MRYVDDGGMPTLELSRRNLLTLLLKLDDPHSARTLVDGDGRIAVRAVPDEEHYADRAPGFVMHDPSGTVFPPTFPVGCVMVWMSDDLHDDFRWCDGGETWSLDDFPDLAEAGVTWIPDLRPDRMAMRVKQSVG